MSSNKIPSSSKRPEDEYVSHPRQTDVLCGRGGMSNHHPGNEWYRRLVKSNRPLYRACPKHTKLLVAKAIVQAVEQQQGRFLEKCRTTGLWTQVSYKRSVDKTSQGLREKDREGEEDNAPFPESPTDMTALVRHMSTRDPPPKYDPNHCSDYSVPPKAKVKKTPAAKVATVAGPMHVLPSVVNGRSGPNVLPPEAPAGWNPKDAPDPTTGTPRNASMYRLLQHTSLLPTTTLEQSQVEQLQLEEQLKLQHEQEELQQRQQELERKQKALQHVVRQSMQAKQIVQEQNMKAQASNSARFNLQKKQKVSVQPRLNFPNAALYAGADKMGEQQKLAPQESDKQQQVGAPGFTRFQSQVSDWLNSFWPLPDGGEAAAAPPPAPAQQQPSPQQQYAFPPPTPTDYEQEILSPSRKRKARHPPPTEPVEEDASQTLLQYATSSKLFRGLSVLFGGGGGGDNTETNDTSSVPDPTDAPSRKPSLLDDYEETPMEARFRQVE